ncbi:hypothetical protein MKEN_01126000 [Mycena kentingensis (nom. inval.)]|nr:hypothetical protein MKEN_01126000 [Mycena kentingensis (nom. inval.)]
MSSTTIYDDGDPSKLRYALRINFGEILSSQLIGSLIDFFLNGVLVLQIIVYHICFPKDARAFKILGALAFAAIHRLLRVQVYSLLVVMTGRLGIIAYEQQKLFAAGFGDLANLATQDKQQWSPFFAPVLICVVQTFFAYRIFSLERRSWPICVFIVLLAFAQCGVGLAALLQLYVGHQSTMARKLLTIQRLAKAWYASGSIAGIINSVTTAYILLRVKHVSSSTRQAVRDVVRFTIETNSMSALVEILALALLCKYPDSTYYTGPSLLLPAVYTNMLLATLNYRALVRHQQATPESSKASQEAVVKEAGSRRSTLLQPPMEPIIGVTRSDTSSRRVSFVDSVTLGSGGTALVLDGTRPSDDNKQYQNYHPGHLFHAQDYRRPGDVEIRVDEERSVVVE